MRGTFRDHTGERFERLVALECLPRQRGELVKWRCLCDCGTETVVFAGSLRTGNTRSCGCLMRRAIGLSRSPEYNALANARRRCRVPGAQQYKDYGGRGIEYRLPDNLGEAARLLVSAIGKRPDGMTLDRIDNNGHYELDNLWWATRSEQRLNQVRQQVR